jgi:hypothetical protein
MYYALPSSYEWEQNLIAVNDNAKQTESKLLSLPKKKTQCTSKEQHHLMHTVVLPRLVSQATDVAVQGSYKVFE